LSRTLRPRSPRLRCYRYAYPHSPSPRSFPTRRSSDLIAQGPRATLDRPLQQRTGQFLELRPRQRPPVHAPFAQVEPNCRLLLLRSEEHTSELQSRENLVCRLLLEKEKHGNDTDARMDP